MITFHTRNSASETINLIQQYLYTSDCKIILHWFSGSQTELRAAINKSYYFFINHKMASSEKGKMIIAAIPQHLLLTETDAPFTFDRKITNRLQSIKEAIKILQ